MEISKITVGQLQTNCYLVWEENRQALIIDPGDSADYLGEKIQSLELEPLMIVATHAHFDHILAAFELKLNFQIPLAMSKKDQFILAYMQKSAQYWLNFKNEPTSPPPTIDRNLKEGDQVKLDKTALQIMATPGHTPGGISLYHPQEGIVFTGDTLFDDGYGRIDLPGGEAKDLHQSLHKLFKLPSKTRVFPGHGPETTIGKAKKKLDLSLLKPNSGLL